MVQTNRAAILNKLKASLEPIYGKREALSIARLALEGEFGWTQRDFLLEGNTLISVDESVLERLMEQLITMRPVQYVLGREQFLDMELKVCEGVLIPRPETELLVEWIKNENSEPCAVLDIGTGSGAIAVALAREPRFTVAAIDVSAQALDVARENAERNNAKVEFFKVDILNPSDEFLAKSYDIIVSNPPYIPEHEKVDMSGNVVNFEPHLALFVPDDDPLLFYREIANHAQSMLSGGGRLYFEIHESFAEETMQILEGVGFINIELRRDINDKARMIRCQKTL